MAGGISVWGIDIGKCALKAVKLRSVGEGKVEILAYDVIEHGKVLSQPDADRDLLIASALEKFLSRHDLTHARVVIGVPGQHTLARFSKLPPVEAKKIPDIVRFEAGQQIPFDMDEVIWDYQTFHKDDSPDVEVGIFAMKRELIREHLRHFESVGIEPMLIQSTPLALYNAAHFDGLLGNETTVLLDIGADNTDLIISTPHSLWTRTIPLGGNAFTEALVKSFKLSFVKAESLKKTADDSKYARQIFQAMRPIFADLVQELSRSIGFYTSTHRDAKLTTILGLGNAFKLPGLQKYLQQNLGMDMTCPSGFQTSLPSATTQNEAFQGHVLSLIAAYGLALQGLGLGKIVSNLLPPEIARQGVWRKKRAYFAAAAACLMVSGIAVWGRYWSDVGSLRANAGKPVSTMNLDQAQRIESSGLPTGVPPREYGETWLKVSQTLQQEWKELQGKGDDKAKQIDEIIAMRREKALWPKILDAIHGAIPVAQPPPTAIDANTMTTTDYAKAVTAMSEVRAKRKVVQVHSLFSQYTADVDAVTFENTCGSTAAGAIPKKEGQARSGFIVTLDITSPNEGKIAYVCEEVISAIQAAGREPAKGFYFNRVAMVNAQELGEKGFTLGDRPSVSAGASGPSSSKGGNRGSPAGGAGGGSGGKGSGGRGSPQGGGRGGPPDASRSRGGGPPVAPGQETGDGGLTSVAVDTKLDPVTYEPMIHDWQYRIMLDVVLGDLPVAEPVKPPGEGKPKAKD